MERLADQHPEVRAMFRVIMAARALRESRDDSSREVNLFNISIVMTCFNHQNSSSRLRVFGECSDCDVSYGKTRFYGYGDCPTDVAWKRTGERIPTMFPSFLTVALVGYVDAALPAEGDGSSWSMDRTKE